MREVRRVAIAGSETPAVLDYVAARAHELRAATGQDPDALSVLLACYADLAARVVYLPDPHGIDLVQTPGRTLARGAGDCDDLAPLVLACARALGFRGAATVLSMTGEDGRPFGFHVLAEVETAPGEWMPLDLAEKSSPGTPVSVVFPGAAAERIPIEERAPPTAGFLPALLAVGASIAGAVIAGNATKSAAKEQRAGLDSQALAAIETAEINERASAKQSQSLIEVARLNRAATRDSAEAAQEIAGVQAAVEAARLTSARAGFLDTLAFAREVLPVVAVLGLAYVAAPIVEKAVRAPRRRRRRATPRKAA